MDFSYIATVFVVEIRVVVSDRALEHEDTLLLTLLTTLRTTLHISYSSHARSFPAAFFVLTPSELDAKLAKTLSGLKHCRFSTSVASDIDECTEGSHNCGQLCINTLSSFTCSCQSGFKLTTKPRTCNGKLS